MKKVLTDNLRGVLAVADGERSGRSDGDEGVRVRQVVERHAVRQRAGYLQLTTNISN